MREEISEAAERPVEQLRRLLQCPGCFSCLVEDVRVADWWECDCGEKLTVVDLRGDDTQTPQTSPKNHTAPQEREAE